MKPFRVEETKLNLEKIIQDESKEKFIVYAHRGASEYTPENTFLAFNTAIYMGANGIETDVQKTKDNVLVLFHDDTLERVTGEKGSISDYTFEQLQNFFVRKDNFVDKIVKLEDFLKYFSFRNITFAIELKQKELEKDVIELIRKYHIENKTVVTSFNFENIKKVKELAPDLRVGYLCKNVTDDVLERLKEIEADEICPHSSEVNKENVFKWHQAGFNVRAWGVSDENSMKNVYDCHADGVTVNFPDKLVKYIESKRGSIKP